MSGEQRSDRGQPRATSPRVEERLRRAPRGGRRARPAGGDRGRRGRPASAGRHEAAARIARSTADRLLRVEGPDASGQPGSPGVTAAAMPRHGSGTSTGASVPNGMSAPAASSAANGKAFRVRSPQATRIAGASRAQVAGLDRCGDADARRSAARPAGPRAGRARPGGVRRRTAGQWREDVERDPHRPIADAMDLDRDAARRGGVAGQRQQRLRRHAVSIPVRIAHGRAGGVVGLPWREERGAPRPECAVREQLEPAVAVATLSPAPVRNPAADAPRPAAARARTPSRAAAGGPPRARSRYSVGPDCELRRRRRARPGRGPP